jgi:hypothetical protein
MSKSCHDIALDVFLLYLLQAPICDPVLDMLQDTYGQRERQQTDTYSKAAPVQGSIVSPEQLRAYKPPGIGCHDDWTEISCSFTIYLVIYSHMAIAIDRSWGVRQFRESHVALTGWPSVSRLWIREC